MSSKNIIISDQTTSPTNYVKMMLKYLASEQRLHNISNVDVNKYSKQTRMTVSQLEEVSSIFNDNMMIYKLVDESKTIVENNMRL